MPKGRRRSPRAASPRRLAPTEGVHPRAADLHLQAPLEVLRRLHEEDLRAVRAVGALLPQLARVARKIAASLKGGGRLIYVGAGTSGRLGLLDAAECPPTFGTKPSQVQALIAGGLGAMRRAVEGAEDDAEAGARAVRELQLTARDVVCGISASAQTPFVHGALRAARDAGASTVLICCNPQAKRWRLAHTTLAVDTGPELITGSTRLKAGTATKLVLNALSTAAMVRLGRVQGGWMVAMQPTNAKLRARAERMKAALEGAPGRRARKS